MTEEKKEGWEEQTKKVGERKERRTDGDKERRN